MSSRSAERAKAVRKAWEREQSLITLGEGTRDWTPEQQQSIVEIGIAVDDEGKAFQGQHMKSVSMFPEYAGDPDNIQFLTRDEHLEAHNGNWQNPTNWYFDPVTKQKTFFNDELIPCAVIRLSDPIFVPSIQEDLTETNDNAPIQKNASEEETKIDAELNHLKDSATEAPPNITTSTQKNETNVSTEEPKGEGKLIKVLKICGRYIKSHSDEIEQFFIDSIKDSVAVSLKVLVPVIIPTFSTNRSSSKSGDSHRTNTGKKTGATIDKNTETKSRSSPAQSSQTDISTPVPDKIETEPRSSPRAHEVRGHPQRYKTKEGVKWVNKDPYPRGESKE